MSTSPCLDSPPAICSAPRQQGGSCAVPATPAAPIRAIILDWSGTLVDDLTPVFLTTNHVLSACGLPPMTKDAFQREFCKHIQQAYVGLGDKTDALRRIVSENRLDPATTLYVGDMEHDIEAGHGAGLRTCAVLGGYTDAARLQAMQPGLICHDLGELAALIQTHP